jgi:iron-sulfur cluster assembly protein
LVLVLIVTDDAATAIKTLCDAADAPPGAALRIYAEPVGDDEAALELALTTEPGPGDEVVQRSGATIYLEHTAAAFLDDKVLDAETEGDQVSFSIDEPPDEP